MEKVGSANAKQLRFDSPASQLERNTNAVIGACLSQPYTLRGGADNKPTKRSILRCFIIIMNVHDYTKLYPLSTSTTLSFSANEDPPTAIRTLYKNLAKRLQGFTNYVLDLKEADPNKPIIPIAIVGDWNTQVRRMHNSSVLEHFANDILSHPVSDLTRLLKRALQWLPYSRPLIL